MSRRSVAVREEILEVRAESSEVRDERLEMMAVDTVKEVTMITVRENEAGCRWCGCCEGAHRPYCRG